MKKYEIRITNHAEKDLKEIFQYIGFEFGSIDTAIKQIKRIQKAAQIPKATNPLAKNRITITATVSKILTLGSARWITELAGKY